MSQGDPIKIAVVGGGCASIAAAFELTRPEHQGRYQVTVYQLGWRLGGKGASGRGAADRIEEHGLHYWMGFYENAFRLMRECYSELGRDRQICPIADWGDAFTPMPFIGVTDRMPDGEWILWKTMLPPTEGLPGDPFPNGKRWSVLDYMKRSLDLLRALLGTLREGGPEPARQPADSSTASGSTVKEVLDGISRLLEYGGLATLAGLIQAISFLEVVFESISLYPENVVLRLLDAIGGSARRLLEQRLGNDPTLRRVWQVIDLTLAALRGEVRFGLISDPRGFEAIDDYDSREWLVLNGASEESLDCGFIRALYDMGFSYEDGDPARPRIAAGQALRATLRFFFTYRGSMFWRMEAGMGDIVFAPFYEVLKRRGVRFEFFHRLRNVKLADSSRLPDGDSPYVEALELDVQADVLNGGEYQPLVEVGGLPCWPSLPDYGQLADGERLRREGWDFESHWDQRRTRAKTLRVVDDFDLVVLGIGIGAVPQVCSELVARDPRWRAMVDHVKTVPTQAFQIWTTADMRELGWPDPAIVVCGFTEPFDTWADMRHLIQRESWPRAPRALAYFCSVLPDDEPSQRERPDYPGRAAEMVRLNAIRFLNRDVRHLWPAATRNGTFRWEVLADPAPATTNGALRGERRFDSQYWRANVNPSDRYTLSLPGSIAYRISPLDGTYDNLTICGDWTDCGFNAGCVEAAVMSGRLAAHAITRSPALEDIVGYDHP